MNNGIGLSGWPFGKKGRFTPPTVYQDIHIPNTLTTECKNKNYRCITIKTMWENFLDILNRKVFSNYDPDSEIITEMIGKFKYIKKNKTHTPNFCK